MADPNTPPCVRGQLVYTSAKGSMMVVNIDITDRYFLTTEQPPKGYGRFTFVPHGTPVPPSKKAKPQ